MHRLFLAALAAASVAYVVPSLAQKTASEGYRISGPFVHENLAVYFVHGKGKGGPVPLTLEEALAEGLVNVYETGQVNQLAIENLGREEVFVQSGDIVKGGRQDRLLTVSLTLPPNSGRVPIASFCVEQGRWAPRGREEAQKFSSSSAALPSREAKLAVRAPQPVTAGEPVGVSRQAEVWRNVARIQDKLSGNVGAPVASGLSRTSLQLSLENEKLAETRAAYVKALQSAGENESDIVGYVFAINGKLNSGDLYPSNGLFRKMWPKLLAASATEAISEKNEIGGVTPSAEAVLAFLSQAEEGKPTVKNIDGRVRFETREAPNAFYFEAARPNGAWVHKNYLAK
jgi:hypothetical protein